MADNFLREELSEHEARNLAGVFGLADIEELIAESKRQGSEEGELIIEISVP